MNQKLLYNNSTTTKRQEKMPDVIGFYLPRRDLIMVRCPFCGGPDKTIMHEHGPTPGPHTSHCHNGDYNITLVIPIKQNRPKRRIKWNYGEVE